MENNEARELYDRVRACEISQATTGTELSVVSKKLDDLAAKWDRQTDNFWRTIWLLISALLMATLGPKAVDRLIGTLSPGSPSISVHMDVKPWDDRHAVAV